MQARHRIPNYKLSLIRAESLEAPAAAHSAVQLVSSGIDPLAYDVIVAKGVHAPVAAYEPVCPTLIRVNTPGITTADMDQLEYQNRRKPLFPFEG